MAEVLFRARLSREESSTPWGFRLQGGADYKKPLTLLKVVEGSIAAKNGLHHSDILVKLAGKSAEGMTHKLAQEAIIAAGNSLEIIVERAEATIQKSPPGTPTTPQKVPNKPIRIETMVFESSKRKQVSSPEETTTVERAVEVDVNSSQFSVENEASENIPSNSNLEETTSDTVRAEAFVKDPAEFQVNWRHKPGAKRSESDTGEDTSPELSSSESAESLDTDTADFGEPYSEPKVPEEKLLSTADDDWAAAGARSSRSPVPPGGEAWRREYPEYEESGISNQELVLSHEGEVESGAGNEIYSTTSSTVVRQITTLEQPDTSMSDNVIAEQGSYNWRPQEPLQEWREDDQIQKEERDSNVRAHIPGAKRRDVNYGAEEDGSPSLARGHVGGDDESGYTEDAMVTPSLTFVGRRIAPPSPTVEETSTNQGPSPHISVTPSSPPSGLTVLPLSQLQKHHRELSDQNVLSHVPFDLSQLSQEMSDIKQEAIRLMTNNAYHSPRLEDIHFSTGGPEVVDIPMPAVKEMVEDLNRRLEAIAAQQPKIAQPPTAQELGISYIKQCRKELEEEEDPEKEIFIDMPPADISMDSYAHRYLGNTDGLATNNFQKLYDASSPGQSPTYHSTLSYRDSSFQERGSSPRNQRRVHFADPPEQAVIEIESNTSNRSNRRRRRKEREKTNVENSGNEVPQASHDTYDVNKYSLPPASPVTSSVPSATDVLSYSTSTVPVMIERPAARLEHYPSSTSPNLEMAPYPSAMAPTLPVTGHPGQFSVSITHKKSDQATPTRLAFTLPSGQPGQPTHFRYTMSGSSPSARTPSPQMSRASDAGLTYSLPPRYEDSIRMMNQAPRSYDDYYLMQNRRMNAPRPYRPRAMSPQPYRQPSPLTVETSAGSLSPRGSPVFTQRNPGYINPIKGTPASLEDTTQSKSFRALEAHYTDGSYEDESSRVQILGTPQQVLQPAAVGRPFSQMPEPRTFTPPPPQGAFPGPPPAGSQDIAGAAIGPGLFALFDSSFTDKFVQWQQSPRSHFESETYKLVHEMEGDKGPGSGQNY